MRVIDAPASPSNFTLSTTGVGGSSAGISDLSGYKLRVERGNNTRVIVTRPVQETKPMSTFCVPSAVRVVPNRPRSIFAARHGSRRLGVQGILITPKPRSSAGGPVIKGVIRIVNALIEAQLEAALDITTTLHEI